MGADVQSSGIPREFLHPEKEVIQIVKHRTLENALAYHMSRSGIAIVPHEKEKAKQQVREIIEKGDGLVWVDEKERILEVPFVIILVTFRRI